MTSKNKTEPVKDATMMAVERTLMAADRSMMAWLRTGLSLISFGFTIYKFLDSQSQQLVAMGKPHPEISSPKIVGLIMIGIGILSLIMGSVEYLVTSNTYRHQYNFSRPRYSLFMTVIILMVGIILFLGIFFRVRGIS